MDHYLYRWQENENITYTLIWQVGANAPDEKENEENQLRK